MPLYDYQCDQCETVKTEMRSVADRDNPVECDNCKVECKRVLLGAPTLGYHMLVGGMKISDSFNDRLKQIKKVKGSSSTIETRSSFI